MLRRGISFGRIAGIPIHASWTWLPIVGLIVWTLAADVFPNQNPGLSDTEYVVMAVVAATLFFTSLVLHELGHALRARREGMQIDGIILWLFGGIARFTGEFPSAGAEFRIAIAGPAVSFVIGVVSLVLAVVAPLPPAVDGVAAWLGYTNLVLLTFNLLPAYPLDGGRILHAALWAKGGKRERATTAAAGIGRFFGYLLIGGGIAWMVLAGGIGGLWLAVMGWFLLGAASGEARSAAVRTTLEGLTVADVVERDPVCVAPSITLTQFVEEVVWSQRYTTYPVFDGEHVVGLLPFRRVAAVPRSEWDSTTIAETMVPLADVVVVGEDAPLEDVVNELAGHELQRGLVLEGDRLVGLISVSDVARAFQRRARML
jgi:Zn-dependent protease/predicted transcriptional regulator